MYKSKKEEEEEEEAQVCGEGKINPLKLKDL
jgi:hypothetical protein